MLDRVSRTKQLWIALLESELPTRSLHLPSYMRPLDELSEQAFEALSIHMIRLRQYLCTQQRPPTVALLHGKRSVTWVRLIRDRWLVVAASNETSSVLYLWSMRSLQSQEDIKLEPACEAYLEGPVINGMTDSEDEQAVLALETRPITYA